MGTILKHKGSFKIADNNKLIMDIIFSKNVT